MIDSWGNLKVSGDFHPKRRQVCSLRQKEVKLLSSKYSDTSAKLQDLSSVLDDGTLLAESMIDSWGNLKISGDFHPKRRQVCSLRQKEVKLLSSKYSDTSAKLQDLSSVLDDGTLLAGLDDINLNLNISLVKSEMIDNTGVDAATLAKNWGIGLEAVKRTRLVTTQRGIRRIINPSLTKRYKINDKQLRYRRLPVTMYTDTMFSTILSRQKNKAAQIFCTDFGFVRAFTLKK
jgi:hypothetical protein